MIFEGVSQLDLAATLCFLMAVIHTFSVSKFQHLSHRFPPGSPGENFFHLIGEVEVSFGIWAGVFIAWMAFSMGSDAAVNYLQAQRFTEPIFVFVIMAVCSTRPVHQFASFLISRLAALIPAHRSLSVYVVTMTLGPLLGSFITEPAAMTVTALVLIENFYRPGLSRKLMYATLGLLFVNVSIGGTLTPYAAPPVLMVAGKWNWDVAFMLQTFGWKALLTCLIGAVATAALFRNELKAVKPPKHKGEAAVPAWVVAIHLLFLFAIVATHQVEVVFLGIFMFFLGLFTVTKEYQSTLRLRGGLLVAFFLGGIIVLGEPQRWWLEPLLRGLDSLTLFGGAIALTSITDNAALAYLGSQIEPLSADARYALIAGSVIGGGLTVIANAPNPVGFGLLNKYFGDGGIQPAGLLLAAFPFTLLGALVFWIA